MKVKFYVGFLSLILCFIACSIEASSDTNTSLNTHPKLEETTANTGVNALPENAEVNAKVNNSVNTETPETQKKEPKTLHEFYSAVPTKYLRFDQCEEKTDKDCKNYREKYFYMRNVIEDEENGYLRVSGENLDPFIVIALFKRPDNSYLVGITSSNTATDQTYFLTYDKGKWKDVSAKVVPDFSNTTKSYELPRYGTKVKVVKKVLDVEGGTNYEEKLYDLEWKNGKFQIQK